MIFHLVLTFPTNYPVSPPHVRFCNYLSHPNIFTSYICLDMLELGSWSSEDEKKKLYTGWSSAYSVSSILLQLQEFFSSKAYSSGYENSLSSQKTFKCSCGHNSVSHVYPSLLPRPRVPPALTPLMQAREKIMKDLGHTKESNLSTVGVKLPPITKHKEGDVVPTINCTVSIRLKKSSLSFDTSRVKISKSKTAEGLVFTISDFVYTSGWNTIHGLPPTSVIVARSDVVSFSLHLSGDVVHFFTISVVYRLHEEKQMKNGEIRILEKDKIGNLFFGEFVEDKGLYFLRKLKFYIKQENLVFQNGNFDNLVLSGIDSMTKFREELEFPFGDFFSVLPKEIIFFIFKDFTSYDLICIAQTCRAFRKLSLDPLFWSTVQRANDLVCFHLKTSFTRDVLGFGINYQKYPNSNVISSISSPLDLLSYTAYYKLNVRKSVWKEPFEYWLPIFINRKHGIRAVPIAKAMLSCIFQSSYFSPDHAFKIFPKLMNTMVVTIMNGSVHASIKALEGYCHFHRFFLHFVEEYPELLDSANDIIRNFIYDPQSRIKKAVPNLGEFLPYLAVTDQYSWEDIREAFLLECFDRNVKWIIEKFPNLKKVHDTPSVGVIRTRITKTFEANKVSMRLLMFHVYFLRHVAKPEGQTVHHIKVMYDTMYGVPTHTIKENLQSAIKDILTVDSWVQFFDRMDIPLPSTDQLYKWLCDSVHRSEAKRYHFRDGFKRNEKPKSTKPKRATLQYDDDY